MIGRGEAWLRAMRRLLSRSEWSARLLGLSNSTETATEPGLVLVQIDGLSRRQLERAVKHRRLPFLRRLLENEQYELHTLYSGLPSSTPAVQGELFYGQKCAVPAFSYRDSATGGVVRMFEPHWAAAVEAKLSAAEGPGLLEGGSAYSEIYSGGAAEPHFSAATAGWGELLRAANPLTIAGLVLWHGWSLVRVAALVVIELGLAVVDCTRGMIAGRDLGKEIKFIPSRVGISILLRDAITIGASMDVARGLPIVHFNFVGYDEQAHRRGPASAFAHWSLKGIDRAIARVWKAARRSSRRDYAIWIYADHGQERTRPYPEVMGRTLQEAIADVFEHEVQRVAADARNRGEQSGRAAWLKKSRRQPVDHDAAKTVPEADATSFALLAMGPIGHLYPPDSFLQGRREELALALVEKAGVPMVLITTEAGGARAFTRSGTWDLPEDGKEVFGPDHPFLDELPQDLVALCRHPDAGEFVLCGWSREGPQLSFAVENGAHAGPGAEETRAFAIVPTDCPLPETKRDYLRPVDLRRAALHFLGRETIPGDRLRLRNQPKGRTLRIMTYNVHSCIGMDGKLSPARIARVIAQYDVDVVALQEIDVGRRRTAEVDQAHEIAHALEMEFHFHPSLEVEEELYGDAVLSRRPMRLVHSGPLPSPPRPARLEPRGALWVELIVDGCPVQLINTHLGLLPRERTVQVDALLGPEWYGHPDFRDPAIICGDFNGSPRSRAYARLCEPLRDAQRHFTGHRPRATWFSRRPVGRIDHVFISQGITVRHIDVPRTELARVASDHLPLLVEVSIDECAEPENDAG